MRLILAALFAVALIVSPAAYAVQPDEIMTDPLKEARARDLSRELRCMVCQNQSIDDSEAPLARDLRLLVRERGRGSAVATADGGRTAAREPGLGLLRAVFGPNAKPLPPLR